jgi:hypothetical protein
MSPETTHPIIMTFGKTQERSFALILCIGREPYTDLRIENYVGSEPVARIAEVDFWYVPHAAAACVNGQRPREFLRSCGELDASPIVIADVLHRGITGRGQRKIRRAEPPHLIRQNIENIFAHETILDRVKLVVLAGLGSRFSGEFFDPYAEIIQQMCGQRGKPIAAVPFFLQEHAFGILDELNDEHRQMIRAILDEFLQS